MTTVRLAIPTNDTSSTKAFRPRCGDCAYLRGACHPAMPEQCANLGILPDRVAPDCFLPNAAVFRSLGTDAIRTLAGLVTLFTPAQARTFSGFLRANNSLKRVRLTFLQKVFFPLGRGDYLDQWYCGYAFGVGPDKMVQIVGSRYLAGQKAAATAMLAPDSVYTEAQFTKVRDDLTEKGRFWSLPERKSIPIPESAAYEPPTFETSPEALEALAKRHGKARGRKAPPPSKGAAGSATPTRRRDKALFTIGSEVL